MDNLMIPFLFSIRAAISILMIMYTIFTPSNFLCTLIWLDQTYDSLAYQLAEWMDILACDCFLWLLMSWIGPMFWILLSSTFSVVFCIPIAFYAFYKSVYDFGPIQRSLWEILTENVPQEEYYVDKEYHKPFTIPHQKRFTTRPVSRKSLWNKRIHVVCAQPFI